MVTPDLKPNTGRYVIIATQWNMYIVNSLTDGAKHTLLNHGIPEENITVVICPGAFEIPLVAKKLASSEEYDAIIALGAVIRGGTAHFEYVAGEAVKGLSSVMLAYEIPVAFGILTVDTLEQAIERAGTKMGNKGAEAATAALEMVNLLNKLQK
ncbi:MAG: 6,7-dimethyl-8-ribityllumazine synthase [Endozoicomonadaceae bacterium]|nr:6,7-dimethyl-8-ribityllumazine synthase [Endozoicomonadaceae bacterium]MCY4329310.1 6,7-dimethyl-8-ribityllumazine synthase [Endozoicomonadaceae bacterium]